MKAQNGANTQLAIVKIAHTQNIPEQRIFRGNRTHQSIVEVEKGLLELGQVEKCFCFCQGHPNVVGLEPEI